MLNYLKLYLFHGLILEEFKGMHAEHFQQIKGKLNLNKTAA